MLAARLVLLQRYIDQGDAVYELENMFRYLEMNTARNPIMGSVATLKLLRVVDKKAVHSNSTMIGTAEQRRKLVQKLEMVRDKSNEIVQVLNSLEESEAKEAYLVRQFIVESQDSFQKKIAFRHFFALASEDQVVVNRATKYTCLFLLFCYICGTLAYIFLTGVSQGTNTTNLWLQSLALAICQDIVVLKPIGIWVNFIAISSIVADSVHNITVLVKDRLRFVLHRTRGVLQMNSLMAQHFNPACRAARAVPHLNTSKLLIALNDFDLPVTERPKHILTLPFDYAYWLFFMAVVVLVMLPEIFQEAMIETCVGFIFNFLLFLLVALQRTEGQAAVAAVIVFVFLCLILREVYAAYQRYLIRIEEEKRTEKVRLYHERLQAEIFTSTKIKNIQKTKEN